MSIQGHSLFLLWIDLKANHNGSLHFSFIIDNR